MTEKISNTTKKTPSLVFCVIMDLAGMLTFISPGVGEWFDVLWAPISAYIFFRSFGGRTGKIGAFVNFVEEIIPFTDVIPTYVLAWIYERVQKGREKE